MNKYRIGTALIIGLLFAVLTVALLFSGGGKEDSKINIGAPYDSGGMIIHYLITAKKFQVAKVMDDFAMYPINDCCTSTSEWALSTDELDIALLCPDAAKELVEKDRRFEIAGPALVNSDVIVITPGIKPQRVSFSQKRNYQKELVSRKFGPECAAVPMLSAAVPYALGKKAVDGAVVDILKGILLKGEKISSAGKDSDLVTYVLVVRKDFRKDPLYPRFMALLKEAVDELNTPGVLIKEVKEFKKIDLTVPEVEQWGQLKIRYVFPG